MLLNYNSFKLNLDQYDWIKLPCIFSYAGSETNSNKNTLKNIQLNYPF